MERITVSSWEEASRYKDHTDRYELALKYCTPGAAVLDAGCGVGYGTYFLASQSDVALACGVDNSVSALALAERDFSSPKIVYLRKNLDDQRRLGHLCFDLIACFETIEYLMNDLIFLNNIRSCLKRDGVLVISIRNRHDPMGNEIDLFRYRDYRTGEFKDLLRAAGYKICECYTQYIRNNVFSVLQEESDKNNIFACRGA